FGADAAQQIAVDEHAVGFHLRQHRQQRHFQLVVQRFQPLDAGQFRVQTLVQLQRDVGVLGGVGRGSGQLDLVEGELFAALAGNVGERRGAAAEVLVGQRVHVVARGGAVEHVGGQHGVVVDAGQLDAVPAQHVEVVFQVLADLG